MVNSYNKALRSIREPFLIKHVSITLSLQIGKSSDKNVAITSEILDLIGFKDARTRRLLSEMIADGIIVAEGTNRNRVYKLKM